MNSTAAFSVLDCLGEPVNPSASTVLTNSFTFEIDPDDPNNGQLLCEGEVLAEGFNMSDDDFGFKYGVFPSDGGKWIADEDYKDAADIADWNDVISVRVTVRTNMGLKTVFTATSRHLAVHGEAHAPPIEDEE
ncbi:MAG: hypothetical protein MZV65_01515 [Chromatiales bacterium]|nr:hypothetical protein [Chromatiales bacterium]